jgi:hypothetical protein
MYDAIDDPYTYESSTVLINILDLREQAGNEVLGIICGNPRGSNRHRPQDGAASA